MEDKQREPRKISQTFKTNGYTHTLIDRKGSYALYSQASNSYGIVGYELHKIRIYAKDTHTPFFEIVAGDERLASNEEFGTYGWSYISKELAMNAFLNAIKIEEIQKNKGVIENESKVLGTEVS